MSRRYHSDAGSSSPGAGCSSSTHLYAHINLTILSSRKEWQIFNNRGMILTLIHRLKPPFFYCSDPRLNEKPASTGT